MYPGICGSFPLAFEEAGHGPPVLMVHGLLSDSGLWARVAGKLASRFRVIRCDLKGHGRTPRRAKRTLAGDPADLIALMQALELPPTHLVSHGSGCMAAVRAAFQSPGRALSLAVVDPVVPRPKASRLIQDPWHVEMLLQWLSTGYGSLVRQPENVRLLEGAVAQQTLASLGPGGDAGEGAGPEQPEADLARLGMLRCPLLALVGERESLENKALVATIFGEAPRFHLQQVRGARRQSPLEAPDLVAVLLERFLGSA